MKAKTTEVTLTQAQIGAAVGVTQSQASRDLRAAGIEPTASGYTLSDLARLAEWRALERVGASSDGVVYDTERERGRLLAHQASLAELRLKEANGELVSLAEVQQDWVDIALILRGRLLALPQRIAVVCAHDHHARVKLEQEAYKLVCDALNELASSQGPECLP